jgi:hypothetical protein
MTTLTNENLHCLHVLLNAKPKLRKIILQHISPQVIKLIAECCHNFINQNLSVTPPVIKRLYRDRKSVRTLANRKPSLRLKRKILVQKGGGIIQLLLPAAITLISSLLKK